jgi:hypothetical protein
MMHLHKFIKFYKSEEEALTALEPVSVDKEFVIPA